MDSPSTARAIPLARVKELIGQGIAVPLLRDSASPVRIGRRWWATPADANSDDLILVEDSDIEETFDDYERRLRMADRV